MLQSTMPPAEPVAVNCNWAPGLICAEEGETTMDDARPTLSNAATMSTIHISFRTYFIGHLLKQHQCTARRSQRHPCRNPITSWKSAGVELRSDSTADSRCL